MDETKKIYGETYYKIETCLSKYVSVNGLSMANKRPGELTENEKKIWIPFYKEAKSLCPDISEDMSAREIYRYLSTISDKYQGDFLPYGPYR